MNNVCFARIEHDIFAKSYAKNVIATAQFNQVWPNILYQVFQFLLIRLKNFVADFVCFVFVIVILLNHNVCTFFFHSLDQKKQQCKTVFLIFACL